MVAEIATTDRDGNEICFHSLRNSYISYLANSATPAKVIQKLARHSDPRLTFNTYARTFEEAEQKAMNFLPNVSDFATSFAKQCVSAQTGLDYSG
jgi:integrase